MNHRHSTHLAATALSCLLAAGSLAAAAPAVAQAKYAFEPSPVLAGSELAAPALLKGPLHTVAEPVTLDGNFGRFIIESKFGRFVVVGENMLAMRVHELAAIQALQEVQSSQAFQDALLRSASAPIQFVQSAFTDPLGTAENVGQGLGTVLGRIGFLARSTAQTVADSTTASGPAATASGVPGPATGEQAPSGFMGDPFGYNKARRDWARQLNIDPYTTNPVLRPLLDNAARASFAGSFAVNTTLGAVSMGANMVVEFDTTVRDAVWNKPALDLARDNEAQLIALGVNPRTTRDFIRNRWFTPTMQTALATALAGIGRVEGVESVIQVASQLDGETRVRFLVDSIRMLKQFNEKEGRIVKLRMSNLVPVGVEPDGTLVIAAALDYADWDPAAAEFAQRKDLKGKRRIALVAGQVSRRATQEFEKAGLTLRAGLRAR